MIMVEKNQVMFDCALSNKAVNGRAYDDSPAPAVEIDLRSVLMTLLRVTESIEALTTEVLAHPIERLSIARSLQDLHVNDIGDTGGKWIVEQ